MNAHILTALLLAWFALLSTAPALAQQPQRPPVRSITRIAGDLYRVQNNEHYTVFLVTPAGIILADPINVDAAAWIKAQLTERFPNAPVRYVLYSHHHQDHASGAAIFNDTAELVGHENFVAALKASAGVDATAAKRFAAVMPPESTYSGRRTITLGGKRMEMIHPGRTAHAPDLTVLYFPAERVVFGADFIAVNTVPGSNTMANGASVAEYVNAVKAVEALDFEHFVCSHGRLGKKADVTANLRYREAVVAAVREAIAAGKTLEQTRDSVLMSDYKDWEFYEQQRPQNVAGAYRLQTANR
jgi:glyoxylase-like metal-dependent hydrolase (beta-lactamase superfamily II)